MDQQFVASMSVNVAIGVVGAYQTYLTHVQTKLARQAQVMQGKKKQRFGSLVAMVALCGLSWIPYLISSQEQLVNDGTDAAAVTGYGGYPIDQRALYIEANGKHFMNYASSYKMVALASHWDGSGDPVDTPYLYGSAPYDIHNESTAILITPRLDKGRAPNFALLLVPNGIETSRFSTIRQAQSIGAKWVWKGTTVSRPTSQ